MSLVGRTTRVCAAILAAVGTGCAPHGQPEEAAAEVAETAAALEVDAAALAWAELEATCRAAGPAATGAFAARVPNSHSRVDAISGRIEAACLERGSIGDARCLAAAATMADVHACTPDWALPWVGVASCDAFMHDVTCLLGQIDRANALSAETTDQIFDALMATPLTDETHEALERACDLGLAEFVRTKPEPDCLVGRTSMPTPATAPD